MGETTADVRREIAVTRERMSGTLDQLEQKLDVMGIIRDHPIPVLVAAFGAGVLLSTSGADAKAAAAALTATKGASNKLGEALDDVVGQLMEGVHSALDQRVNQWVDELKVAIGAELAPTGSPSVTAPRAD